MGVNGTRLADAMVQCDLRELTNLVRTDGMTRFVVGMLGALVIDGRKEPEAWELRREFLDSLAHECLLMPASIRDAITSVATAAFHQVRLSIDRSYRDRRTGEPGLPTYQNRLIGNRRKGASPDLCRSGQVPPGF